MNRLAQILLLSVLAATSGCKIVHDSETANEIPDGPDGDDARNSARLEETFEAKLVPLIIDGGLAVGELRDELAKGLDEAGAKHGNRGAGVGAAWNFSVADEATIIETKLDSSARTLKVDTDADGAADVTVQLGPVIRGTALRDVAPFYNFDDFRDQIEFAKLARAINEEIKPTLVVPDGDLVGTTISFIGVVPLKKADENMVLTPILVEFEE